MLFIEKTLMEEFYITNKAIFITKQVWIINKTDFIIVILDVGSKIFIVYIPI